MSKLDGALLDLVFQSISNFTQRVFGVTCFLLAKVSFMLSGTASIFVRSQGGVYNIETPTQSIIHVCFIFFYYIFIFIRLDGIEKDCCDSRYINKERINGRFFRHAFLVIFCLRFKMNGDERSILLYAIDLADWFLFVAGFYFTACTPLPPCESGVRSWINSAKKLFQFQRGPQPVSAQE